MPADIGVSGVEKDPSFFRSLFPAFSFFSIYTQSFASRTYGSHLRVSGWISLIPLRPALSSDVSRMISKLESFSFLPFCLLSISAYRFDVNNPASFGVIFVTRRFFFFFLLLWMTSFHMPIIVSTWFDPTGSVVWVPASSLFCSSSIPNEKVNLLSLPLMVMIIRLPRKIRRNEEMNDLDARVLHQEYFVLGWLSI